MSADRETRQRLEEVQQRLVELQPELALEETPGFTAELNDLERKLDLARQRTARTEERLLETRTELEEASRVVRELDLAAQAKQSNAPSDLLVGIAAVVLIGLVVLGAVFLAMWNPPDDVRTLFAVAGLACSFSLGAVLRARVVRPKPRPRFR